MKSWFRSAVLYTALALGANTAYADMSAIEALRAGDMKKLAFHEVAKDVPDITLQDASGQAYSLKEFHLGQYVVLNFWATWCAPCRKEMPSLDRLQAEFGGEDFAVVPVATGRNPVPAITKFFEKGGIENLPIIRDPQQELAREMMILGLPITVILNRDGQEIARLRGDAEWDSDSAKAIVQALITQN